MLKLQKADLMEEMEETAETYIFSRALNDITALMNFRYKKSQLKQKME